MTLDNTLKYLEQLCFDKNTNGLSPKMLSLVSPKQREYLKSLSPQRREIYRRLVFNSSWSIIKQTFPLLHEWLNESTIREIMRYFYDQGHPQTNYYKNIPIEFKNHFTQEFKKSFDGLIQDLPLNKNELIFFIQILDYECCQYELLFADEPPKIDHSPNTELHEVTVIFNPNMFIKSFDFEMTKFKPQDENMPPFCTQNLIIYRRPQTYEIEHLEIGKLAYSLIQSLLAQPQLALGLNSLSEKLPPQDVLSLQQNLAPTIRSLVDHKVILALI